MDMRADQGQHTRTGTRVNSRVPLAIGWIEDGQPLTIQVRTIDTSSSGCLVHAPQIIILGQPVRLINLINGNEINATVVRHGQHDGVTCEFGIQLEKQSTEFRGLEF